MNHPHHRSRLRGLLLHAGLAAALLQCAGATPVTSPGYTATPLLTHSTSDTIISYDWAAATGLYYMTTPSNFDPGLDLWKATGSAPQNLYTSANYVGNNVVASGDYVYFNDSDFSKSIHSTLRAAQRESHDDPDVDGFQFRALWSRRQSFHYGQKWVQPSESLL